MNNKLTAGLVLSVFASAATASEHNVEIDVIYSNFSTDYEYRSQDLDSDTTGVGVAGTFYLDPVNAESGPLAEAAFITRASAVAVAITKSKTEYSGFSDDEDEELTTLDAALRIGVGKNFVLTPSIGNWTFSQDNDDTEVRRLGLDVGLFAADNQEIYVGLAKDDVEDSDTSLQHLRFGYHGLINLSDTQFLDLKVGYDSIDIDYGNSDESASEISLAATYYPTRNFGIGLTHSSYSDDDSDSTDLELNAEYFFSDTISGSLSFISGEDDHDSGLTQKSKGFNAGASFRF